jgi:hypothetical protein
VPYVPYSAGMQATRGGEGGSEALLVASGGGGRELGVTAAIVQLVACCCTKVACCDARLLGVSVAIERSASDENEGTVSGANTGEQHACAR